MLQPGLLAAALVSAGLGAAVVLLIAGLRGVVVDPARPPSRGHRWWAAARSGRSTGQAAGRDSAALGVAALTMAVTRWPVAAVGLGALVFAWPRLFGAANAEQAQIARLEALVTWTESLRDTIAAHHSLEQAIPATTDGAPAVIRPALVRLAGQIRARTPMETALLGLAADLDDASADHVIAALILNTRRRGDRLADVLSGLAATARSELDLRRRISAGRAGLRRAVQIVAALTIAFAVFLVIFGGTYLAPYATPAGQVALAVVIGMFAAGFAWMRQLSQTQSGEPFLTRPGRPTSEADLRLVAALTPHTNADTAHPVATAAEGMGAR